VTRTPRQRAAERTAIRAAADRLLAGMPLRTASGRLTVTELMQDSAPEAMRELAERNTELAGHQAPRPPAAAVIRGSWNVALHERRCFPGQ
jgi:hypothetical protein